MKEIKSTKYTSVIPKGEKETPGCAHYTYDVITTRFVTSTCRCPDENHHKQVNVEKSTVATVQFQKGVVTEAGLNGVMNEDLIVMVIDRLESFQDSEFRCRENAVAITKLQEALMWLRKRTEDREARGVEGTYQV